MEATVIKEQGGHGDLYARRIEESDVPVGVLAQLRAGEEKCVTLALGEVTGHAHQVTSEAPIGFVRLHDMVAYVLLRQAGLLEHTGTAEGEGHGTRVLEPGIYEIPTERDYDPTVYARQVLD